MRPKQFLYLLLGPWLQAILVMAAATKHGGPALTLPFVLLALMAPVGLYYAAFHDAPLGLPPNRPRLRVAALTLGALGLSLAGFFFGLFFLTRSQSSSLPRPDLPRLRRHQVAQAIRRVIAAHIVSRAAIRPGLEPAQTRTPKAMVLWNPRIETAWCQSDGEPRHFPDHPTLASVPPLPIRQTVTPLCHSCITVE
jgi:hypothetical protein